MIDHAERAAAIVGVGAILPEARDAAAFWSNIRDGRYAITDVDPARWDPALYYDPDPRAPEKTYSKIGGWVRDWDWDPLGWRLPMPPKVTDAMDDGQKWAVACTRMALADAGWPERPLNLDRTAVVLGNAMAGEKHYLTSLRITFPELARELERAESFAALPAEVRAAIASELRSRFDGWLPPISEDSMPGELANCTAGRIANLFNLHGPNFTVDAACASALAAMETAVECLADGEVDVALTGGVDRNMGASSFVKFCAIGALSATGTRPYADGADGFVMGEGAALFVLKRLADAERDGDRIYAVVRGIAGASDGRGKGITAPNPVGQRLAIERAWRNSGLSPADCTLVEGHGTSTRVGDVVEVGSLTEAFGAGRLEPGSIALGSVKSNIGHLKAAAGAAGILKTVLAIHDKVLPPSVNFTNPNPNVDWSRSPFAVNTELREWDIPRGRTRVAGVSAFGFGGTNFHLVMEEHVPGHLTSNGHGSAIAVPAAPPAAPPADPAAAGKPPLRGALVLGASDEAALANELRPALAEARQGRHLDPAPPSAAALGARERIAIDYGDGEELIAKAEAALKALAAGAPAAWAALRGRGIFRGSGDAGKVAFLYTGQGSQYAGMLAELRRREPVVADTFDEADEIMRPLLEGRRLSDIIFPDPGDPDAVAAADAELRRTEITQPAVLTVDIALTRLLAEYGIAPDVVMGHSLGEYGALVAAGALSFDAALEAVSARGREMASLQVDDPGAMAAVMAPLAEVEEVVTTTEGYVVLANVNSTHQVVLGGATDAVGRAVAALQARGHQVQPLPVSHAFHTDIVAPAGDPLRATLKRLGLRPPQVPIVANVDGELYPSGDGVEERMLDILARQVASPVQFVKGLHTLHDQGARVFVEVGPKRALQGFADDVLGNEVMSLATNHPKPGDVTSFNAALCGLWASGLGAGSATPARGAATLRAGATVAPRPPLTAAAPVPSTPAPPPAPAGDREEALRRLFAEFVERGNEIVGEPARPDEGSRVAEPVVITGAGLGLPGAERVFDDGNLGRLLEGGQGIDVIPGRLRREILDKHITRLVKGEDGGAAFETIDEPADVIKLAARAGAFDLEAEFGVDADRMAALGRATQLAIAAGIDALRDAGIPLVRRYRTTTKGTRLPDRWVLPDDLRDDTGVIFASAFPGLEEMADEVAHQTEDRMRRERMAALESLRARMLDHDGTDRVVLEEVERRIHDLGRQIEEKAYTFDRRFLFRVLSMGHSQLAELIGARGPNTQVNAACASTTQAVALAEDWIRAGRCRRVIVVAADDATSDTMLGWIGAGFLASGAAATDEAVEDAALPFDQRRHGMIIGMGAAGLVVEAAEAARERGIVPICEVLGTVTANSAFHGTRLDVEHIGGVMEQVVSQAEARGLSRTEMAGELMFVSHETYTPARGGSAAAEIHALRRVFGDRADRIVIANTKGLTGHPMGVGIEDVVAVKALETGVVPPVPNFRDVDPDLGALNLSHGGAYPVRYALRLAAGFGSQISMLLLRWTPVADGRRRHVDQLGYAYRVAEEQTWRSWLRRVSGQEAPRLEVVQHRLRVVDAAPPATEPVSAEPVAAEPVAAEPVAAEAPAVEPAGVAEPVAVPSGGGGVESRVLGIVAEQTGYPEDLLDLDLDLEADLGIDTVKQAEVFATIREAWGIERDDTLKLRDYPTLGHVVGFVRERMPAEAPAVERAGESTVPAPAVPLPEPSATFPRRVPVPVLRPPLDACVPTGVALGEGCRVIVMPDAGGVAAALRGRLETLGVEVLTIEGAPGQEELERRLGEWTSAAPVHGVYWLPALDVEASLGEIDPAAWHEGLRIRIKLLAVAMRALAEQVGPAGTFLVSATRLGGRHGYDDAGATSAMGGAVTGFTKALSREREDALVKAVDFAEGGEPDALADLLLEETLRDPGAVEVAHADELRWTVGLVERSGTHEGERELSHDDVFLVTGAAGSIVSAITSDLAAASGATFHLLDLTPEPDAADEDLARFRTDRDGLKRDLADRMRARGERPTPALVERELARLERARAGLDAIEAIRRAGGTAHWHQVDLTDAGAVAGAVGAVLETSGRVDVLLHCAGLEISHFLPDKPQREYDLVFDVKADGWLHLLHALGDRPPGRAVAFSSIAGRFGNAGQTDYSAANDLLCKSISQLRRRGVHGVAIDWTAWASIGMASRGSIPKMMEVAGIEMLPPDIGVPVVRRELTAAGSGGELLVAGSLGVLLQERHATGGLDAARAAALAGAGGPMTGRIEAMTMGEGIRVLTDLDPTSQAFLDDHRIEGTPVLPGVMGMEGFAEAAHVLLPGWEVVALEDVELLAPFKFYRDEPRTIELRALVTGGEDGTLVADCRLIGRRTLPGQGESETLHFTGRARLARELPQPPEARTPPAEGSAAVGHDDVYRVYFHGPAYQVLDRAWRDNGHIVGALSPDLPPDHEPADPDTLFTPRLVELCFQTAGVWELGTAGRMALPTHVDRVLRFAQSAPEGRLCAVVTPRAQCVDADVVDDAGRVHVRLEGYRTIELPGAVDPGALGPIRTAMGDG
ncbi:MAG TPA: SDR family NAD(P)-dependent oxidoreductase [Solirubrobacteraceae bacterium]|nr:SDR family NAD(P)-dependent oxidoreductase [Solirubrobacteraceae bacterium]